KYVASDYGVEYNPVDECIITVGVSEALDLILRALINPGDEIIYHEPCYVSYRAEIVMAHGKPVAIETREENDFALDPEDFRRAITPKTKAVMLNFPCNPTGATLDEARMKEIAKIAVKHDLIVLTDEIYSELSYGTRPPCIASFPGMRERTVFLHGFSKAFAMTGFRIGYACGPAELIDAMMKIHQYSMLCASILAQEAAEEALKHGRDEMMRMRREYCERRNLIVSRLNEMGLRCFKPNGAFYAFPNIRKTGLSSLEFAKRLLQEQKVAVVPGTAFGACAEGFVRCAYAASMDNIVEAMNKMEIFVKSVKRSKK
ncbi:MAG: aromatic amino acid aminotransferase, partial [Lentisphaerae bacterium GWF2_52_8]